jgi:hypothetical protein
MINTKIEQLLDTYGMTGKKASEIMGITYTAFRMKRSQQTYNKFYEEHLQSLLDYLNKEAVKIPLKASDYLKDPLDHAQKEI